MLPGGVKTRVPGGRPTAAVAREGGRIDQVTAETAAKRVTRFRFTHHLTTALAQTTT
jgi:hypothetical protein